MLGIILRIVFEDVFLFYEEHIPLGVPTEQHSERDMEKKRHNTIPSCSTLL